MSDDTLPIIDAAAASLDLGAIGQVCVVVLPDGSVQWWLVVPGAGDTKVYMPEHELVGPLPPAVMARVLTCGQVCADGHLCRVRVGRAGRRCTHHRRRRGVAS